MSLRDYHTRNTLWRISHSSLIRFGTSLSSTLVLAIVKLEREREKKKRAGMSIGPYSISNFWIFEFCLVAGREKLVQSRKSP